MHRRDVLMSAGAISAGAGMASATAAAPAKASGGFFAGHDGASLFYKDWGVGRPVVFLHSWALNADMWEYQMTPLAAASLRCIAYDRRGHGRSSQPGGGYDIDGLADDLAALMERLDLRDAVLVGHSMGCCEAVRYLRRHGSQRVSRLALLAPTTPMLLQTGSDPGPASQSVAFERARAAMRKDRAKWRLDDNARPFVTAPQTSQGMLDWMKGLMMQSSLHAWIACNEDHREQRRLPHPDVRGLKMPTLVLHTAMRTPRQPLDLTGRATAAPWP